MSQQMSLDTEAIAAATNSIDADLADMQTAMNQFLQLLNEKVQDTKGDFALIKTLEEKLQEEAANIKKLAETVEEIEAVSRKYVEQAEEANDDSAFRS